MRKKKTGMMESLVASPIFKSFISGSLSGFTSTIMFQPFDLVKTRIQTASMNIPGSHHNHTQELHTAASSGRIRIHGVVLDVVREEKIRGLWKGVTPSIIRTVPGVGLYFSVLHSVKAKLDIQKPTASQSLLIGAASRTIAGSLLLPFTVIKARYESGFFGYTGVTNAFVRIYQVEGVRGLWSGLCATVLRDAPFSGLYLMFYNQAKTWVIVDEQRRHHHHPSTPSILLPTTTSMMSSLPIPTLHFLCGLWAGVLASIVTQPPDVLKTYAQLDPKTHRRVGKTAVYVFRRYGVKGFFRGLIPRTMRRTLMAATAWTIYEQLMNWVGLK